MEIPDEPTIYDYLILSLRSKDIIATFNWDPLLLQTMRRHSDIKNLPTVVFLHGNVAVGVCLDCNITGYKYNHICHRCYKPFHRSQLLYPVQNKNYSIDNVISGEWETLKWFLSHAYYITIFGYSAPSSDVDAKALMLDALGSNKSRIFSELEFIDIKSSQEVSKIWDAFIYKGYGNIGKHYSIKDNFSKSYLNHYPRRSCDAFASATLMNNPWPVNSFPRFKSIEQMHQWIEPLLREEKMISESLMDRFLYKTSVRG